MPLHREADPSDDAGLEKAVEQAIAACGGDLRATVRALIVTNSFLEDEITELIR